MIPKITGYTKITGVIGDNIQYTKSPLIHNYWYQKYGIDGVYVCFNTNSNNFKNAVTGLFFSGVVGLNVTVPFKEQAFLLCDTLTPQAQQAGAVNCLKYVDNKIIGHNTDGIGFYNALRFLDNSLDLNDKTILIIGAGGAASAIISYLCQFRVTIKIINRTLVNAQLLVDKFVDKVAVEAVKTHTPADIIIQTTNVKKVETGNILDIDDSVLAQADYVMDINYGDNAGDFLIKPKQIGIKNCDGSQMLLHQAAPAFEFFNGTPAEACNTLRKLL